MINFFKINTGIFKVTGDGLEFANTRACMIHKILEILVKNFFLNEVMKHLRVWHVSLFYRLPQQQPQEKSEGQMTDWEQERSQ